MATPFGVLVNELCHDCKAVIQPLLQQATRVSGLCVGDYDSGFATVLLFLVRTLVRLHSFAVALAGETCDIPRLVLVPLTRNTPETPAEDPIPATQYVRVVVCEQCLVCMYVSSFPTACYGLCLSLQRMHAMLGDPQCLAESL